MIGAIKIKDGLFIGDELASTVSKFEVFFYIYVFRIWNLSLPTKSLISSTALASKSKIIGSLLGLLI